ncbi:MAG: tRNA 2-thiouridine(34) synthase MnmA [Anaerolineae bacterium]|nr:tRNA 2-thiouridine(34) synthase MnmA [Anaerolineae bacterium]
MSEETLRRLRFDRAAERAAACEVSGDLAAVVKPSQGFSRIVVALSGGVDSAVAAALLVERGYEVVGVMLRLWVEPGSGEEQSNRCCTPEAVDRARRIAAQLDIPFYLVNAEDEFKACVVDYLVAEYGAGRTPNPCVRCNRTVRFDFLLNRALALGAEFLATGHYARAQQANGRYQLLRGLDSLKDQSYFLHALSQEQLAHVLFPLGELTKEEVRAIARDRGMPVAEQPESQDLCFLADGDYRRFLERYVPHLFRPGPICDASGHVLGQHKGLPAYTIGQRKGLEISAAEPLYVLAIEPAENVLVVGSAAELGRDECVLAGMHYIDGKLPTAPFNATAQIRYRARPAAVVVKPLPDGRAHVRFAASQRDITPGQFLVLYKGEIVLGGGTICMPRESML